MITWSTGAAAWTSMVLSLAAGHGDAGRAYYQLHYDYEVAAQCGLITRSVEQAFRRQRRAADGDPRLASDRRRDLRIRAYVAAAREYDNRGLGGNRAWCWGEVRHSVERLLEAVE